MIRGHGIIQIERASSRNGCSHDAWSRQVPAVAADDVSAHWLSVESQRPLPVHLEFQRLIVRAPDKLTGATVFPPSCQKYEELKPPSVAALTLVNPSPLRQNCR